MKYLLTGFFVCTMVLFLGGTVLAADPEEPGYLYDATWLMGNDTSSRYFPDGVDFSGINYVPKANETGGATFSSPDFKNPLNNFPSVRVAYIYEEGAEHINDNLSDIVIMETQQQNGFRINFTVYSDITDYLLLFLPQSVKDKLNTDPSVYGRNAIDEPGDLDLTKLLFRDNNNNPIDSPPFDVWFNSEQGAPEPATMLLLGLGGLALMRRRRQGN